MFPFSKNSRDLAFMPAGIVRMVPFLCLFMTTDGLVKRQFSGNKRRSDNFLGLADNHPFLPFDIVRGVPLSSNLGLFLIRSRVSILILKKRTTINAHFTKYRNTV